MKSSEAFQYLLDHNVPITLIFPFEEEKGHIITGKGTCHIEKIHDSSRITLGKFSPQSVVHHLKKSKSFQANFEIKGETYFCAIEKSAVSKSTIITDIPTSMNSSMRKFSRVEPSMRSPVMLYICTPHNGTISFTVKDLTEQGVSFTTDSPLAVEDSFMCGLQIPVDKGTFIFSNATVVYKIESLKTDEKAKKLNVFDNILYGLALFPHSEDAKKIRLYMSNRDLEIKKKIQKGR